VITVSPRNRTATLIIHGCSHCWRLERDLEEILQASVDIVPADGVKPRARRDIEVDAVAL